MHLGSRPGYSVTVRYFDGNLYEVAKTGPAVDELKTVWVPADQAHASAMAARLRSQPQVIYNPNQ
jgi:hypothetical protein